MVRRVLGVEAGSGVMFANMSGRWSYRGGRWKWELGVEVGARWELLWDLVVEERPRAWSGRTWSGRVGVELKVGGAGEALG